MNNSVSLISSVRTGALRILALSPFRSNCSKTVSMLLVVLLSISPLSSLGQRAIQNPSVENPGISANSNHRISENTLTGWLTTHPFLTCDVGPSNCRPIERWGTGFNGVSTGTSAGSAFVELNAEAVSMIYQQVCMTQGESFTFSFLHRGRSSANTADVADFRIGIPTGLPTGSKAADSYSYPILRVSTSSDGNPNDHSIPPGGSSTLTTNRTNVSADGGWRRYGGRYLYNGPTQVVNIGFSAVSTAGGDVTVGNFIDDWQVQLAPYIEAAAVNTAWVEGSTGASLTPDASSRPALRISGTVGTGGATVIVAVTGGTGVAGTDYSLTQPFQLNNTTSNVTINIPAGSYDGVNSGVFNIPFSTRPNTVIQPHRTVNFTISSVSGGAHLASLSACGQPATVNFSHLILDDDSPTSAEVPVTGRVLQPDGRGIAGTLITMIDAEGNSSTAITNPFGYFRFTGVSAGSSVVLSASSKRHTFSESTKLVTADGSLAEVVFVSN